MRINGLFYQACTKTTGTLTKESQLAMNANTGHILSSSLADVISCLSTVPPKWGVWADKSLSILQSFLLFFSQRALNMRNHMHSCITMIKLIRYKQQNSAKIALHVSRTMEYLLSLCWHRYYKTLVSPEITRVQFHSDYLACLPLTSHDFCSLLNSWAWHFCPQLSGNWFPSHSYITHSLSLLSSDIV